ncbi:MAG TPA: LEA type 2 family protein [Pseudomonadales bacterium]|nr:LEA type 2 family protein [Pseudomonadales bacterium]
MPLVRASRPFLLLLAVMLAACAGLTGPVENPRVTVTSLRLLPADGVEQRIEVGLRLLNPNSFDLHAKGLVISLGLNGVPLLKGATSELPLVPAYGEAQAKLTLNLSLMSGLRLMSRLAQQPDEPLQYRLEARLDLRRPLWKRLMLMEQGEIAPRPANVSGAAAS